MRSYILTEERRQEIREKGQRVEPHAHSYYSLLDGATVPEELIKRTLELNMPAACISDHGVMYSLVDLVNLSKKHNQKYMIAMEAYVVRSHIIKTKAESSKEDGNGREHLLLIAINNTGYKNLMRLASIAATEGFYYRPRIDDELLKKYSEGLIATSTCLGSRFSQLIMRGNYEGAKTELKKYQKLFDNRFYLEIQPTKEYFQKMVNHAMIKLGKELGIPLVATTDAHYLHRQDTRSHDVLLTMQSNDTLDNPLRWQFPGDTFFIAGRQEMFDLFFEDCVAELDAPLAERPEREWKIDPEDEVFEKTVIGIDKKTGNEYSTVKKYIRFKHNIPAESIEDAMDNSVEIADRCETQVDFDKVYLPKVAIPDNPEFEAWHAQKGGKKEENYLRYLCIKGLKDRGKTSALYRERLEHELSVINGMGFPDYFLLLEDVMSWCAANDIPVGPGRGCFTPDQKVNTLEHGLVKIQDVKAGDHVLTHRKVFKPVKGVQIYEIDEKIAKARFIDNEGNYSSIRATEDHEIFAIPKEMGLDFKLAKWMPIGELKKGDILLKPIGKDTPDHFHKEHKENCVHCNGKPVTEEYDEMMRQFHETAMNSTRVIEKAISTLSSKVDDEKSSQLTSIQESFEGMRDAFGFDLTIERTFEEACQDLIDLGFIPVTVDDVEFEHYTGPVYDLSVEGVSSYTVNGVAVHNSAAGSLVSFAIGITNVDPIEYGLLFERFLNPKRGKLPDIDIDFCIKNRGRVMSYIMEKHGREHTANIATFGRLQTKAVIKDVAKAMAIPFEEVNAFTKLLPSGPGQSIHVHEIKSNPEFSYFVNKYPDLFEHAAKLEGSPRHVSQHAAGMVVSPPEYPLWSLIPLQKGKEVVDGVEAGYLTQLEKGPVEQLGLVKFDILGLKNVTELHEQFKQVKQLYGKDIDFNSIPLDDDKTWDLIGKGHTLGVFQFASALAIGVITKMKPRNIEELSAANAFIRPGASGLDEYIAAKSNPKARRKMNPELDKHLDTTYGSIVYQEQIMGLIAEVMGIDFGEADEYRRMLEKAGKYPDELAKWKIEFTQLGLDKGYSQKLIDLLVQLIIDNSGYGFNKSHAVSYSIISYWTAYMKANFPLVFYTTLLNGNLDEADAFIAEARQLGIEVLPPHVNTSKFYFSVENGEKIRAGFNAVKGIGPKAVDAIIEAQPFKSIDDFKERTGKTCNKKVWEAIIKFGAFDGLGIEVEKEDFTQGLNFEVEEIEGDESKVLIKLNRKQMTLWYEKVQEESSKKAPPNYLVTQEFIPGKYIDNPDYDFIPEKDGSGYVIPEDRLKEFGINAKYVGSPTRKKPKGMFAKKPINSVPVERRVFTLYGGEISNVEVHYMDVYLEESEELGFSFLPHPLENYLKRISIYEDVEEGALMMTAGIIEGMQKRMSKNNKPYYWVFIRTPRDRVRFTLWDNQLKQYQSIIKKNNLIAVKGFKGFGGMSMEEIKVIDGSKLNNK